MHLNVAVTLPHGTTHEGAPAAPMNAEQALRRSVMSCLLWESEFYEDGEEIASRIVRLCGELPPEKVADLAIEVRTHGNLRHVPLLLLSALAKRGGLPPLVLELAMSKVIQRADELTELLAIHAKVNGVKPSAVKRTISAQMKKGLAAAFNKFNEYQLAKYTKYNSPGIITLRDVLFLCHAKPRDDDQAALWKRLIASKLEVPDTWEIQLRTGADKKETFERLIREGKLGYLALLRNLRNMLEAASDANIERCVGNLTFIKDAIIARKGASRVLPFRYIAAARAAPMFEPQLDQALCCAIDELPVLPGETTILVDVSGSMMHTLSSKSDLSRMDAAAALAAIWPGQKRVFTFSDQLAEVPPRKGMACVDAIIASQPHFGTWLGRAVEHLRTYPPNRFIVITDEQSHDSVGPPPCKRGYMINVASAQRGVGYGSWTHIDGFSENVIQFILEHERLSTEGAEAEAEAEAAERQS